jgi:hypothetical protein
MTEADTDEPYRPKPPTPDGLPWEERQPSANPRRSGRTLAGRDKPETRPDAFAY